VRKKERYRKGKIERGTKRERVGDTAMEKERAIPRQEILLHT
jgi:hypothetical protein